MHKMVKMDNKVQSCCNSGADEATLVKIGRHTIARYLPCTKEEPTALLWLGYEKLLNYR